MYIDGNDWASHSAVSYLMAPQTGQLPRSFSELIHQYVGEKLDIYRNNKSKALIKEGEMPFAYLFIYIYIFNPSYIIIY